MKRTALLLLLALPAGAALAAEGKAVTAAPRLRVRRAPSVAAVLLGSVKEGEPLILLEKSTFTETIDERRSPWYRVRTLSGRPLEGWAFGGYMDVALPSSDGKDPWLSALCYADIKAFGESEETASAKLGAPLSARTVEEPNRHDEDQTVRVKTLKFPGASLRLLETPHKSFLEKTVITADVPGLNDLLKMGSSPRRAREILGDPRRDDIKTMTYDCNPEQNDRLILSFTLDRLSSIEFSHFAD